MNIVNPYRFGGGVAPSTYEPETDAYIARVEADGGTVIDADYVDTAYKKLKSTGLLNSLQHWTSAFMGIKINTGEVEKLYSLDANNNDAAHSAKPNYNGNGDVVYTSANNDRLSSTNLSLSQFTVIAQIKPVDVTIGQGVISNWVSGASGLLFWIKGSGLLAIRFYKSGGFTTAGDIALTNNNSYIVAGQYDQQNLKIILNGSQAGNVVADTAPALSNAEPMYYGYYTINHSLEGIQNEQIVFNTGLPDLTTIEFQDLMNVKHLVY